MLTNETELEYTRLAEGKMPNEMREGVRGRPSVKWINRVSR